MALDAYESATQATAPLIKNSPPNLPTLLRARECLFLRNPDPYYSTAAIPPLQSFPRFSHFLPPLVDPESATVWLWDLDTYIEVGHNFPQGPLPSKHLVSLCLSRPCRGAVFLYTTCWPRIPIGNRAYRTLPAAISIGVLLSTSIGCLFLEVIWDLVLRFATRRFLDRSGFTLCTIYQYSRSASFAKRRRLSQDFSHYQSSDLRAPKATAPERIRCDQDDFHH